jgi:hypothetical protein
VLVWPGIEPRPPAQRTDAQPTEPTGLRFYLLFLPVLLNKWLIGPKMNILLNSCPFF